MTQPNKHGLDILSIWHQTEFFNSVDLKSYELKNSGVIHYKFSDFLDPFKLPWIDRKETRKAGDGYSIDDAYNYKLYLGVFERKEFL